ncbi:hypothetical protein ACFE04_028315 [Oxalis oulophora]
MKKVVLLALLVLLYTSSSSSHAFQSDELVIEDEEFGLEGRQSSSLSPTPTRSATTRKRFADSDSDSKIQFTLEHAFGDSDFLPAGTFSARLKPLSQGGQTLTKLRFSRNRFSDVEEQNFKKLLQDDEFYRIRLPSNVLTPPGRDFVVSSVRARCLPQEALDEHFILNMEGVNILGISYGSSGACPYPRQLKFPGKWSFNSHTVLKQSEQAPRAPIFAEEIPGELGGEAEAVQLPEKTFWAKYVSNLGIWMYMIPLGLIVMNAITQAMNLPEEQAGGQPGAQTLQAAVQRGPSSAAVRRR